MSVKDFSFLATLSSMATRVYARRDFKMGVIISVWKCVPWWRGSRCCERAASANNPSNVQSLKSPPSALHSLTLVSYMTPIIRFLKFDESMGAFYGTNRFILVRVFS